MNLLGHSLIQLCYKHCEATGKLQWDVFFYCEITRRGLYFLRGSHEGEVTVCFHWCSLINSSLQCNKIHWAQTSYFFSHTEAYSVAQSVKVSGSRHDTWSCLGMFCCCCFWLRFNFLLDDFEVSLYSCLYSPGYSMSLEGRHRWCLGGPRSPSGTGSCLLLLAGRPCSPRLSLLLCKLGTCTRRSGPKLQGSAAWPPGKHRSTAPVSSARNGNAWLVLSQCLLEVSEQRVSLLVPVNASHSTGVRRHVKLRLGGASVSLKVCVQVILLLCAFGALVGFWSAE